LINKVFYHKYAVLLGYFVGFYFQQSQSVKQRTKVAKIFANEDSCLRLVTAVVMEISEQWQGSKAYLSLDSD
jgi:transposase-like protein